MKFLSLSSIALTSLLFDASLAGAVPKAGKKVDYNGYKVIRVSTKTDAAAAEIEKLAAHVLNPGKATIDVVVAPENVDAIKALNADASVVNEDVGAALKEEGTFGAYAVPDASWFTSYHSYADHLQFLRDLQAAYPSNSAIITAGTSVQGRTLTGIHIWGSGGRGSKPAIVFHGTVHAREWITTMSTEYNAFQLLTKYSTDSAIKAVVDKFDFYIMPIVNPDGFVYSQTTDRLWRKNRQTVSGSTCIGRDNNRNWPYNWQLTGGASTNPCSETFKGRAAADAPENRGMINQLTQLRDSRGIRLYIDFHSYGQYILWPYGYSCSARAENDGAHRTIATNAANAIRAVSGTRYTFGPSCSTLYATTGSSTDYTDVTANATYSYTYELRDTGANGFVLPASQIQPTVVETWAGVLNMLRAV